MSSPDELPADFSPGKRLYIEPAGILWGGAAEDAILAGCGLPLCGPERAFTSCIVALRSSDGEEGRRFAVSTERLKAWADGLTGDSSDTVAAILDRLSTARSAPPLDLASPLVMGVVNITPDSFSGDGLGGDSGAAIEQGRRMAGAGADILDIGGESTRPGAMPVSVEEELDRVIPVIEGLAACGVPISIDSRNAAVMKVALDAGAAILNDISAMIHDPASLGLAAACDAPVILMHCLGEPRTMQDNPRYADVLLDVYDYLEERVEACVGAGIDRNRLIVDPGIGFGKNLDHNLVLLRHLALFHGLGCALLLGASRKRFIGELSGEAVAEKRVSGSLAAAIAGFERGAHILRVHDVGETCQARAVWRAIAG